MLRGLAWQDLYLLLFMPALREIGTCWAAGTLTAADEHQATAIVERLMARVYPGAAPPPQAPLAVVACVEGNRHCVGARMAADFLADRGWRVHYLGADTPTLDLVRAAAGAAIVALSACQSDQLLCLRAAAAAVRHGANGKAQTNGSAQSMPRGSGAPGSLPVVIAGGQAVAGQEPAALGVDIVDRYLPRTLRMLERDRARCPITDRSPAAVSPARRG
jgi:hypothetical protein